MNEFLHVLDLALGIASIALALFIVPFVKFVFDLRLKVERIEVLLNIILKDVEKLKKEIWNGEENKD